MHTLVLSDTHLMDPFEEPKYRFLSSIIEPADRIIINGDFWDGYLTTFDRFLASPWNRLFPLLKKKEAIYLFGNHDKETYAHERGLKLFSRIQGHRYSFKENGKTYLFEHGNRIIPFFEELELFPHPPQIMIRAIENMEKIVIKHLGNKAIRRFSRKYNNKIRHYIAHELKHKEILFTGHTHFAEIDLPHRFVNTGFIKHGLGSYATIQNSVIELHEQWYN